MALLPLLVNLLSAGVRARQLYRTAAPISTGRLAVSPRHTLYYEEHGKQGGAPALFLHGGPGAGCFTRHAGFFDPSHYRVVLFDQRGCGKSAPRGELEGNDTPRLIEDCEALRSHLGIAHWEVVLGGSWGTTLALAYASRHPERIRAIVLRAVCLMRAREIRWLFASVGVGRLLPAGWHKLVAHQQERLAAAAAPAQAPGTDDVDAVLAFYAHLLSGAAGRDEMAAAAAVWSRWEMSVYSLGSRLPLHVLPCAQGAGKHVQRATWKWEPTTQQWRAAGDLVLPPAEVEAALVMDGFEARVATSLATGNHVANAGAAATGAAATSSGAAETASGGVAATASGGAAAATANDAAATATASGGATGAAETAATATARMPVAADTPVSSRSGVAGADGKKQSPPSPPAPVSPASSESWVPVQARLTSHYSVHHGFLEDDELLSAVPSFRHIPCIAVQGANDLICPPATAYELHAAWPEMELRIVPGGGHSMYDAGLQAEVLDATDKLRARSQPGATVPTDIPEC